MMGFVLPHNNLMAASKGFHYLLMEENKLTKVKTEYYTSNDSFHLQASSQAYERLVNENSKSRLSSNLKLFYKKCKFKYGF